MNQPGFTSFAIGLALCALGGTSGGVAAVFGKLSSAPGLDLQTKIPCYVLLCFVSRESTDNVQHCVWRSAPSLISAAG